MGAETQETDRRQVHFAAIARLLLTYGIWKERISILYDDEAEKRLVVLR